MGKATKMTEPTILQILTGLPDAKVTQVGCLWQISFGDNPGEIEFYYT